MFFLPKKNAIQWNDNRQNLSAMDIAIDYDQGSQTLFLWDTITKFGDRLGYYQGIKGGLEFGESNVRADLMLLNMKLDRIIDHLWGGEKRELDTEAKTNEQTKTM